jgi:hypothetical protein
MKKKSIPFLLIAMIPILAGGCAGLTGRLKAQSGPSPLDVPTPTPLLAAEVQFSVLPPPGTPSGADISLIILDEVTGADFNSLALPMTRASDGSYRVSFTPPVGALLRYRYERTGADGAIEVDAGGNPIRYRLAHASEPMQFTDVITAWNDLPYEGGTGRIVGKVTSEIAEANLGEILISIEGMQTFTDGEGAFRIDGLPVGLHRLTVLHPEGRFYTAQQGAQIAVDQTTPVVMALEPAQRILVTFELTVPPDTIPGTPVRLAGNTQQLGNRFRPLPGGLNLSVDHMPGMVMVDDTHYLAVFEMYSGTDLHYKYTLGDGLWNGERAPDGAFFTRQVILPSQDLTLRDTVSTWHPSNQGSISFHVTAPENTPPDDILSLQFKPSSWYGALPMWKIGEREWFYILYGPTSFSQPIEYRYCRNQSCGIADDSVTAGREAVGRPLLATGERQDMTDKVQEWQWLEPDPPSASVVAPEITGTPGFLAGIEFSRDYQPAWNTRMTAALADLPGRGVNAVAFTPAWQLASMNPLPILEFDPVHAPYANELGSWVRKAKSLDLQVTLRPSLRSESMTTGSWWTEAIRDPAWWEVWFTEYRSFILTYAELASRTGADRLVLSGAEIAPALPGGHLPDGSAPGVPGDIERRWQDLIAEIRGRFNGKLAIELEMYEELQPLPPFLDSMDELVIYWHPPLSASGDASIEEMQPIASEIISDIKVHPALAEMDLLLSIEYLSIPGSAKSCPPAPDGSCRSPSDFDSGAFVDPDIEADAEAQSDAVNAVLLGTYLTDHLAGYFMRGYFPAAEIQDKSASINGKLAEDVLRHWYPRMTSQDLP